MKIDIDEVKAFYESTENVWPSDDMWHQYSKKEIECFVNRSTYNETAYLLNAGSGGSDYGLSCKMMHVDIAENKICHMAEYVVSNIETMPFSDGTFTDAICVGSVINYCDALAVIHELARLIIKNGSLILEYESSWGYEHLKSQVYKRDSDIVSLPYFGELHNQWVYSPRYIRSILKTEGFHIINEHRFHYLSGISFNKHHDENRATQYAKYDWLCRLIPFIKKHSNNVIYQCIKL